MNTRFQQGNSTVQSPGIQRPEQEKPVSSRGIAGLVLAFATRWSFVLVAQRHLSHTG